MDFKIHSPYEPKGDQPAAIEKLIRGFRGGENFQTLLGVTGSGKTFTMAHVVEALNVPTLVLSHNKTLAAQLYSEFKELFPDNAVEYFVSYYDYYQPEAYVPQTDTFIEKDSSINEDIDRLRLRATSSLLSRKDCLIVASVSAIYSLGSPEEYSDMLVFLNVGQTLPRDKLDPVSPRLHRGLVGVGDLQSGFTGGIPADARIPEKRADAFARRSSEAAGRHSILAK